MRLKSDLILLLTAFIWGSAFAAQRVAAAYIGPFLFNGSRFLLAVLVLLPVIRFRLKLERRMWVWVAAAGVLLFGASTLQQAGLRWTTAGNAGFITGFYVVLVPIFLWLVWRQQIAWRSWLAAGMAVVGVWMLSANGEFRLALGDALELAGAFLWALHVILISRVIRQTDVLHFAIGQYLVCGVLNTAVGLVVDAHTLGGFATAGWAVAYTGILSVALGYTLQAVGQKHAPATDAALILSMESVFAAFFGYIFLNERLQWLQLLGCGLILAAIILVQFNEVQEPAAELPASAGS